MPSRHRPCPRGVVAACLMTAAISGCGAVTGNASLGSDSAQSATVPDEIIRIGIVLNNETTEPVIVDMDIDGAIVSYPIPPRDVLSLRLKCADIFGFAQIQYSSFDGEFAGVQVDQEVILGVDYDCNDILLLNVGDQGGTLSVVTVD